MKKTTSIQDKDTINSIYFFIDSNIMDELKLVNEEDETKRWLKFEFKKANNNYITQNYPKFIYQFLTKVNHEESIDTNLLKNIQKFHRVLRAYIREQDKYIDIKLIVDMANYDYDFIDELINEVEFPIKDTFSDKLINFEYIPASALSTDLDIPAFTLIFNREIIENVYNTTLYFDFENPTETISNINLCTI